MSGRKRGDVQLGLGRKGNGAASGCFAGVGLRDTLEDFFFQVGFGSVR